MSNDPANIINEYLELIREKLPESIADDVITELETYMMETARDQGEDGQITAESAKKVVAQFGAPGEVADEYRYSMLPETIPEEDMPTEIVRETGKIDRKQQAKEPEKTPPRELGVDPTSRYSTFFFKSFSLTVMWAVIVTVVTTLIGPIWLQNWQLIFIIIPVIFVTIILLAHTWYLKKNKVILWKRSYPDWSIFQILVTLPENSVPNLGTKTKRLDIAASIVGVLLFIPIILVMSQPWCTLIGIPVVILLILRIRIIVRKLDLEKDPYEKSRLEFAINFSLLVLLESSIYWLFNMYINMDLLWNMYILLVNPLLTIFIPLFGTVLLFQVLTGVQNLWWKTEEQLTIGEGEPTKERDPSEQGFKKGIALKGVRMFVSISSRLLLFISIPFLLRLLLQPNTDYYFWGPLPSFVFFAVLLAGIISIGYCIGRGLMIHFFDSSTFIGTRTRLEAIIDLSISCYILVGLAAFTTSLQSIDILHYLMLTASEIFEVSYTLGSLVVGMQVMAILLAFTGLPVRIIGNILEFWSERKHIAAMRIQDSSLILFVTLAPPATSDYIRYIVTGNSHLIIFFFTMYFLIAGYLTYQMVASGIKIEEIKEQKEKLISKKSQRVHSMNDNAAMAN